MSCQKVYLPLYALRKVDIESILSVALPMMHNHKTSMRFDRHHSRRTMLHYLLSIDSMENNQRVMKFIEESRPKIDWPDVRATYNELKNTIEPYQKSNNAEKYDTYWELKKEPKRPGPQQSENYISKYRQNGFQPEELKIYWNYDEIANLDKNDCFNPITDTDTHTALLNSPVHQRNNAGAIQFIRSGIQDAVFRVPEGKQVIVLDFADERMPGGYFIENAMTQEEVILFNSDGYRALLDLKYRVMDGGYMLPEYGVAYIKNVRFFQQNPPDQRLTDLIVSACYDMSGMNEGLYKSPSHEKYEELRSRTLEKFQALIASAVANTNGDGKDTYLLLGPIGTGAFGNTIEMISELFEEVLNNSLMNSKNAIRYAFDQIWFVSIDDLEKFAKAFE